MRIGEAAVAALCALTLAGCEVGSSRRDLGIDPPPPDEFMVVARKPLRMPADAAVLPTPQPGAPSPVAPQPGRDARLAILGAADAPAAAPSASEQALLSAAGAQNADPAIRDTLEQERPEPSRRYGLTSLFGQEIEQDPDAARERLDPDEEAERLRQSGLIAPVAPPVPAPPGSAIE